MEEGKKKRHFETEAVLLFPPGLNDPKFAFCCIKYDDIKNNVKVLINWMQRRGARETACL
jgi:hypothetical protein